MLEIKTITYRLDNAKLFDDKINEALKEGWELTRRDVLPPMAMRNGDQTYSVLYAELERETEPEEEGESEDEGTAEWKLSRTPALPFTCTACGYHSTDAPKTCPNCKRVIIGGVQ